MKHARLSPVADVDLLAIYLFIAEQSGRDQAEHVVRVIRSKCETVAEASGIGRPRPELRDGVRSFAIWSFLVFYSEIESGIEVVRILHGARDISAGDVSPESRNAVP